MIMETMVMIISLRMLKKSHMTFPRSPMRPMQMPNVMKKPMRPAGGDSEQDTITTGVEGRTVQGIQSSNQQCRSHSPRTFMPHLYSSFFLLVKTGSDWLVTDTGTTFRTVWT